MATNFPTGVDTFTNPVSNDSLNSPSHSVQHADANDAIEAIENAIIDPANYPDQLVNGTTATVRPLPFAIAAGKSNFSMSAVNTASVTVTFPASRFSVAPVINFTPNRVGTVAAAMFAVRATSLTSSSVVLTVVTRDGTSITETVEFNWVAIQMTSAAAAG